MSRVAPIAGLRDGGDGAAICPGWSLRRVAQALPGFLRQRDEAASRTMTERRVHWVATPRQLVALGRELDRASEFSLDTEQDSFFAYRPKVCVAQIGVAGEEWIVDVLALDDFSPLAASFADPERITNMHAGENDVDMLRRCCGLEVRGLFDTMAAAHVLGYRRTGLAGLIEEHFGITIEKKFQRSDWRRRPLDQEQIRYAALDVRYLSRLRRILERRLRETGRLAEAQSEFRRIERVVHAQRQVQPDDYLRIRGVHELAPAGRRVLRDLFVMRDEIGRAEDRAVFRVCGDLTLLDIARRMPADLTELAQIRGLSARLMQRRGDAILTFVREAARSRQEAPLPRAPRRAAPADRLRGRDKAMLDRLRRWRRVVADRRAVEPGRVIPNRLLVEIVRARPRSTADLLDAGLEEWRVDEYGADLLDLLGGAAS